TVLVRGHTQLACGHGGRRRPTSRRYRGRSPSQRWWWSNGELRWLRTVRPPPALAPRTTAPGARTQASSTTAGRPSKVVSACRLPPDHPAAPAGQGQGRGGFRFFPDPLSARSPVLQSPPPASVAPARRCRADFFVGQAACLSGCDPGQAGSLSYERTL